MKRRAFIQFCSSTAALIGGSSFFASVGGCDGDDDGDDDDGGGEDLFLGGFTTSLRTERDYVASVRGTLPAGLAGSVLYKNGPGLFERDGFRKNTIVDGDGMVNAYFFEESGQVRFVNHFPRTAKFRIEEEAGRFIYPTWTTLPPDPGAERPPEGEGSPQVGVSVWSMFSGANRKLLAFDESSFPAELDPRTLEIRGTDTLGFDPPNPEAQDPSRQLLFAAHPKLIASTGEVAMFGINYARASLDLAVFDMSGAEVQSRKYFFDLPTGPGLPPPSDGLNPVRYAHDFFATERYLVAALHPAVFDYVTFGGGAPIRESLTWKPELGMRWLVFDRNNFNEPPVEIEGSAAWMWHSCNLYEQAGELVCDWLGYDDPGHFLGGGAEWEVVMRDVLANTGAPGTMRRTIINPTNGGQLISEETINASGTYEFPMIAPSRLGSRHGKIWSATHPSSDGVLWTAVRSVDVDSGLEDTYDFGEGHVVTEPNIAETPSGTYALVEVTRAATSRNTLAVFNADRLADGPVAEVELEHHLPIRFHGHWVGS